jgi:N-acetylglucosamine PTS system EIICBA or EIICB component
MSVAMAPSQTPTKTTLSGWDRVLAALQSLGKSLMLPIAVMPAAALLLRFGQPDIGDKLGYGSNAVWIANAGGTVFDNLPFLFAIGIAIGLTSNAGAAALSAFVGFFATATVYQHFYAEAGGHVGATDTPLATFQNTMGALGGIAIGLIVAGLYNRFKNARLPDFLGFFGGKRSVPIIVAVVSLPLGWVLGEIWFHVNDWVNNAGNAVISSGAVGAGIYGLANRLLIPVGLHHVLNTIVWFQLGTYTNPAGVVSQGDLHRYFAGQMGAGGFEAGFFPIMMFGLPAACLAMIRAAKFPKVASGILLSAAFTSFVTGVTEPIEFAFIFVAPVLYVIHAVLTGTALAICYLLNIRIAFGFSAGITDYILNFSKSNTQNAGLVIVVGLVYAVLYYFIFYFVITRFDIGTPGRGESSTGLAADWILDEGQLAPKSETTPVAPAPSASRSAQADVDDEVLAQNILAALGGATNVQSCEGCITRLRLVVSDNDQVNEARLKELGASGVLKQGKIAQVVLGTKSDRIADRINALLQGK